MNKEYYVYEWFIEDTNEVIYVGKGKGNRAGKIKNNKFFKDMYNTHKCNYRIVKDCMSESDAFNYEKFLIKHYRKNFPNYRLTNVTDGGEGISGWKSSEDFKRKQHEIQKKLWENKEYRERIIGIRRDENGVYKSKEFREKISSIVKKENNPNYRNYWSDEQKNNMRKKMLGRYEGKNNPNYGNKWSDEQKARLSEIRRNPKYNNENHGMAKRVVCMETYEIFPCIKYGKLKYPNASLISDKRKVAKGYHFMQINDDYELNKDHVKTELINFYKQLSSPNQVIFICLETLEIIIGKSNISNKLNLSLQKINKMLKNNGFIEREGFTYIDIKNYSPYT